MHSFSTWRASSDHSTERMGGERSRSGCWCWRAPSSDARQRVGPAYSQRFQRNAPKSPPAIATISPSANGYPHAQCSSGITSKFMP